MEFDLSRDFLEAISLSHPKAPANDKAELKANGGLHFLPSSPDGTMHTAIVSFSVKIDGQEQAFAQGAWRFLFTTSEQYDPKANQQNPFNRQLLVLGASKIIAVLNTSCMHANMPLIPVDAQRLTQSTGGQPPGDG